MKPERWGTCLAVLVVAFALNAGAQTLDVKEDDRPAPVDWGYGLGVQPDKNRKAIQEMMAASAATAPAGGAEHRPWVSSAHRSRGRSLAFTLSSCRMGA